MTTPIDHGPPDPELARLIRANQPSHALLVPTGDPAGGSDGSKIVETYVGNTAAVISDTIEAINAAGVLAPLQLAGVVSRVDLMGQDEATGAAITSRQAVIDESADSATYGQIHVVPDPADVAAARSVVAWWRLTYISGLVLDTPEFIWIVKPHGVAPGTTDSGMLVCSPWATNEDVARYTSALADQDYSPWLAAASDLLYSLSAQQFPGTCSRTVRPLLRECGFWQVLDRGHIIGPSDWTGYGWTWDGGSHNCGAANRVRLAGYVRSINAVKISGSVVDPTTYRVDDHRWLTRLTDPTTGQNPGWPLCQDMALPTDADGTFSVDYAYGKNPPLIGVHAAAVLAWQLYLAENPQGKERCRLPAGWSSVTRQGVTVTRQQGEKYPTESGIPEIDAFLSTVNPGGLTRMPAVYSRDVAPYARRVG